MPDVLVIQDQGLPGVQGPRGNTILTVLSPPTNDLGLNGDYAYITTTQTLYGPKASGVWPSTGTRLAGKTVLTTSGAPSSGVGVDGDFAIDPTTQTLYGPKASGVWPAGVLLKGNTIIPTSGAPSNGVGVNGDLAYDAATSYIYGPKASGTWPAGVRLIGPTGSAPLLATTDPPSDALGFDGDWAINPTASKIYGPKASGTWPAGVSIKGAKGDTGPAGPPGGRSESDLYGGMIYAAGEEVLPPWCETSQAVPMTTQTIRLTYFRGRASATRTTLAMMTGTTVGTPSTVLYGIYSVDGSGNLTQVAVTANDSTRLRIASTRYEATTIAPWDEVFGQLYAAAALCVVGGTAPNVIGLIAPNAAAWGSARAPRRIGAVTGQTTLPATIAAGSIIDSVNAPQVWVK